MNEPEDSAFIQNSKLKPIAREQEEEEKKRYMGARPWVARRQMRSHLFQPNLDWIGWIFNHPCHINIPQNVLGRGLHIFQGKKRARSRREWIRQ